MDKGQSPLKRAARPGAYVLALAALVLAAVVILLATGVVRPGRRADMREPHRTAQWQEANNLARRLNMAGNTYAQSGMYDSALACYRSALQVAKKHGLIERMAASYSDIFAVYDELGIPESADQYLSLATALKQKTGRKARAADKYLDEGTFRLNSLGDVDSALVLLERALAESRNSGNKWSEVVALQNLGSIRAHRRDYDSASVLWLSAESIGRLIHDYATAVGAVSSIARLHHVRDRPDSALAWYQKAVELAHSAGLIKDEAEALVSLGHIMAEQRQLEPARQTIRQAMHLFEKLKDFAGARECGADIECLTDYERWLNRQRQQERRRGQSAPGDFGM